MARVVTRRSRWLAVALVTVALGIAAAPAALAHPLGNFTSNTFARLRVQPQHIAIDYVVDLAEIPALQTVQREDADGDGTLGRAERDAFAQRRCDELTAGLRVTVGDRTVALAATAADVTLPAGEAGLSTLRLECTIRTETLDTLGGTTVRFADDNLADRVGWREVVAVADGRGITTADVPSASISDALRAYPEGRLSSPLDQTTATVTPSDAAAAGDAAVRPEVPAAATPGRLERMTTAFTTAVSARDLTPSFALLAVMIALFLGALHAVAPGHGKTVMAAYLVGRRGTRREALLLGGTVAVTHTAGVLLLGLVVSATQSLAPERLYPVLGAASGVLFAIVGATMLRQALSTRRHKGHHHHHHAHGHAHEDDVASARRGVGWRALVLPGLAGGLVPTPSALVVLLGGIAIGRAWFGVTLVVMYGVGMAATLVGAGYLLLRARGRLEQRSTGGAGRFAAVTAALPVVTAAVVTVGGVIIAARSVVAA